MSVVSIVCDGSLRDDVVLLSLQTVNPDYKQRLMKLANLVLVKFTEDTMVQPRESEVLAVVHGQLEHASLSHFRMVDANHTLPQV